MNRLADLHRRRPALVAALVVALTAWAAAGLPRLVFEDDPRSMLHVDGSEFALLQEFYADFGPDDQDAFLVIEGDDLFSVSAQRAMTNAARALRELPDVETVVGLADVRRRGPVPVPLIAASDLTPERLAGIRETALTHPVARGQFLSSDARTTILSVHLAGRNIPLSRLEPTVRALRETAAAHLQPAGLRLRMAGHPSSRIDLLHTLRSEVLKFALLGVAISGGIALAVFRSLPAVVIASLGPSAGVLWTLGGMAWLGIRIDPLLVVLPTLLFVIGFTDAVHLVADMRNSPDLRTDRRAAAAAAVRHLGPACVLTALTTMAGFGSLAAARTDSIQRFGLTCAAGTLVMLFAVQLVVPSLSISRLGAGLPSARSLGLETSVGWLERSYGWLLGRPRRVAAASILITAVCFLTSLQLTSDLRWTESLPDDSETVQVTRHCDAVFGGSVSAYVVVEWPPELDLRSDEVLGALDEVHAACSASETLGPPTSILTLLKSLQRRHETVADQVRYLDRMPPELLHRSVVPEQRKAAVSMHVPDIGAARLAPDFSRLEERLAKLEAEHPGFRMRLTGTVVVASRNVYQMIADLAWSMTLAGIIIFAMTALLFRSLFLGILSIIPNVFPQAITASLLVWTGRPLSITSVLTFSLCLGLSVDDTVHFLMRFREERQRGGPLADVILRTFRAVGGVMLATSLVLIGGFVAMLVSRMPGIQVFASLASITLVAAIAGDLVMLPSLLLCFSRQRNSGVQ